jgi:uncharacterized membrane protein
MKFSMGNLYTGSIFFIIGIIMILFQILLIKNSLLRLKTKKEAGSSYYEFRIFISSIVLAGFLIFSGFDLYFLIMTLGGAYPP